MQGHGTMPKVRRGAISGYSISGTPRQAHLDAGGSHQANFS
ncbi:hypothetical protein DB31_7135 [Hyalangium minutum]|uniref:Uncharacterized protein n=1 Tax=Hyalangium minutum TaxID=394096 RepID=A0A085WNH0_9BACT|nr:hypothetical protein DB31_7135 [Hyalangium minutum]